MRFPIYLDHNATTPLDPKVLQAMMPYFTDKFGNASSVDNSYGYDASIAVEDSREIIADIIGARHDEIIFTSGATESNNIALIGAMLKYTDKGNHIITCITEHKAVLDTAKYLESIGKSVTYLPVNQQGEIDLKKLESAITDKTVMISIMTANNEIGTSADIKSIGNIAHKHGVIFHTDAAQSVGHVPINVNKMNIDLMSFSAHKMYGPKGIGALYVRGINPRVKLHPLIFGGGQERNLRSGTINVPGVVGFAKAIQICKIQMDSENKQYLAWSEKMLNELEDIGGLLNGHKTKRIHHNLNVYFAKIESKAIINLISEKIAISAGSACTSSTVEPSHVITGLGFKEDRAHCSIRVGFGRFNTDDEIDFCIKEIKNSVKKIRNIHY